MRLEALLLSLYVAVEPSKIEGVDATVLFAKLGGATALIYLLYTTCHSLNGNVVPALVASILASFEALRE